MAIFKCKMCGGDLSFEEGSTVCECEYCGSKQTLPNADSEKKVNLYNRANRLRRNNEFDKASAVYESIVAEFPEEAEAYWGLCLCAYGIEYVDDPITGSKMPTCHRTLTTSIMEDANFEQACDNADVIARRLYRDEAKVIDRIQKDILSIAANEAPYDVFICYKETNDAGSRTEDSVLAQEIYDVLTAKDLKVFFSRITLEEKLGVQYEPYIYAALSSAKVMLAIGTDFEYYDAVWVKNEWSRFLDMMRTDKTKTLIPCFKGIDAYDIPKEFKGLQAQDMSRIGWLQDLTRGVEKLCGKSNGTQNAAVMKQVVTASANIEPLLKRAQMFLEDSNWKEADVYCEKVLDQLPENAQAYLYKLMAELHVSRLEELKNCQSPFDNNNNYKKIIRFGETSLKEMLKVDIQFINDRNENTRLTQLYEKTKSEMNSAKTIMEYKTAADTFKSLGDFKESVSLEKQCTDMITQIKKGIEEAGKLVDVITASEEGKSGESVQVLQEKLEELRNSTSQLTAAYAERDELQTKKNAVEQELKNLRNTREKLGLFAGREKKATDAKIDKHRAELSTLNSRISACQKIIRGFSSKEEVNAQIDKLEKTIAAKKAEALVGASSLEETKRRLYELCKLGPEIVEELPERMWKLKACFAEEGNSIIFGKYPTTSKKQTVPIEWKVLKVQGKRKLIISNYALDCQPYNEKYEDVTWENCTLRSWLNNDFYNTAFSEDEKRAIVQINVTADKNPEYSTNPGNNTSDKVFLLSISEVEKYFSDNDARKCVPTEYAIAQGAYTSDKFTVGGKATCWWWLRSPGNFQTTAAIVYNGGSVYYIGKNVNIVNVCVRPALWINLES